MGKKMKKKAPNARKVLYRAPQGSPQSLDRNDEIVGEHEGEKCSCSHYRKSNDELNRILLSIRSISNDSIACERCREEPVSKRGSKEKGKVLKKKGGARVSESKKESNFIWVCLDCKQYFCGGEVSVSEPYGHARRHSKQEHHMWAVRSDDPLISWCYLCNSTLPIEMLPEEMDIALKPAVDSENGVESLALESSKGYVVRGLSNLGNTCFFNSVMQNLLAMDMLRNYLVSLDRPHGPITMALKKLFAETSCIVDSKNVLAPKALFGSICVKAPQFRGCQQQDSHELLLYLLDGLYIEEITAKKLQDSSDEQEKTDPSPSVTVVDAIFGGQISSAVCCTECGHTSVVHEPFLDLSLPVPSKKPPPKKVPPPPPKRRKSHLKERNKGRGFRENVVAKESPVIQHCKEEFSDAPSECSESIVPAQKPEEAIAGKVEDDFSWMDFCEAPVTQCSDSKQVLQSESSTQDTLDSQLINCSKDLNVLSDSCGVTSCINEAPSSCNQDSNILLLPYAEPGPTEIINGTASCFRTAENVASVDTLAEAEFDGLGDLFNEPEVTSAPKTENGIVEDLDLILRTGNSGESNHDEVDNTNAPVSINSCLALFTKPELLFDEQAWHCENCSQNVRQRKGKQKAARVPEEGESRSEKPSRTVEMDSEIKVSGNGKMTSSSKNLSAQDETSNDPSVEENTSQKPLSLIGGSESKEEIQNVGNSNLLDPDVVLKDEEIAASDGSSHYFSCQSSHENTLTQEKSFNQAADSCSIKDHDGVGCDRPAVAVVSGGNDSTDEVNQLGKDLQLLEKRHSLDSNGREEIESETRKVKRDATKRILINGIPPILTIHLKRFSEDARGRLTKLHGHISFQETLDLRPYMDPRSEEKDNCHFQLIGVVEHSGSMSGGHYIAYVRGERGRGKMQIGGGPVWFYASDAHVREASLSDVLNSDAYILFYERVPV